MNTNIAENYINSFNQRLSATYAAFSLALEDVENITPDAEKYLVQEKIQQIDNLYQSVINTMRPHLRKAAERQFKLGDVVWVIYPHSDFGDDFIGWFVCSEQYKISAIEELEDYRGQKKSYLLSCIGDKNNALFMGKSFFEEGTRIFLDKEQAQKECIRLNLEESKNA